MPYQYLILPCTVHTDLSNSVRPHTDHLLTTYRPLTDHFFMVQLVHNYQHWEIGYSMQRMLSEKKILVKTLVNGRESKKNIWSSRTRNEKWFGLRCKWTPYSVSTFGKCKNLELSKFDSGTLRIEFCNIFFNNTIYVYWQLKLQTGKSLFLFDQWLNLLDLFQTDIYINQNLFWALFVTA